MGAFEQLLVNDVANAGSDSNLRTAQGGWDTSIKSIGSDSFNKNTSESTASSLIRRLGMNGKSKQNYFRFFVFYF